MRLQTLGVQEHSFDIDIGGVHFNWLLYDVGGAVRLSVPFVLPALSLTYIASSEDR